MAPASGGSGPGGSFLGTDFRAAYAPGVTLDGAGQPSGWWSSTVFIPMISRPTKRRPEFRRCRFRSHLLDGFNGIPTTNANNVIEVSMDIELVISMATNLAGVVVFEAGPSGNFDSILDSMAASNQIKQFSSSWGFVGSSF